MGHHGIMGESWKPFVLKVCWTVGLRWKKTHLALWGPKFSERSPAWRRVTFQKLKPIYRTTLPFISSYIIYIYLYNLIQIYHDISWYIYTSKSESSLPIKNPLQLYHIISIILDVSMSFPGVPLKSSISTMGIAGFTTCKFHQVAGWTEDENPSLLRNPRSATAPPTEPWEGQGVGITMVFEWYSNGDF